MPELRLVGPFHAMTGYSHLARAALRAALVAGYTVQAVESDTYRQYTGYTDGRVRFEEVMPRVSDPLPDCQWAELDAALRVDVADDAPTLLIQLPPHLYRRGLYNAGPRIGWTMGESDRLCPEWASGCRGVDTVLVPSRFCLEAFQSAGIPDVRLLPLPIDDRLWSDEGYTIELPEDRPEFLFVSVFSTTERKHWRLLLHAFCEEFKTEREDVGLLIHPGNAEEVRRLADSCRIAGAWVHVDTQRRTDYDMAALYRACDCYVLPSAEGFGLPFVEAALCGLPSVALDDGGAADVVTPFCGYPVPSERRTLIGHLPHAYPYGHLFPQATIEGLRAVLRQVCESRHDLLTIKGRRSRQAALDCYIPAAIAPELRDAIEEATERWAMARCKRAQFAMPGNDANRPQIALAFGAWGDVFTSLGMARQMRDPARPLHVAYYGQDPAIVEFLRWQEDVENILPLPCPADKTEYRAQFSRVCMSRFTTAGDWLPWLCTAARCEPQDVLFTQVNQSEPQPVALWHDAELPPIWREKARAYRQDWGEYILLHPLSVQSAFKSEHWPHWEAAIRWLVEETPYTYVLTGVTPLDVPEAPNLVNLIGKTGSMMEVLALCEEARGVISTCNAVSLWTAMQRIPGLIVANAVFDCPTDYYLQWVDRAPNTLLYRDDTLKWFRRMATAWLGERFPSEATGVESMREEVTA